MSIYWLALGVFLFLFFVNCRLIKCRPRNKKKAPRQPFIFQVFIDSVYNFSSAALFVSNSSLTRYLRSEASVSFSSFFRSSILLLPCNALAVLRFSYSITLRTLQFSFSCPNKKEFSSAVPFVIPILLHFLTCTKGSFILSIILCQDKSGAAS